MVVKAFFFAQTYVDVNHLAEDLFGCRRRGRCATRLALSRRDFLSHCSPGAIPSETNLEKRGDVRSVPSSLTLLSTPVPTEPRDLRRQRDDDFKSRAVGPRVF